MAKCFSVVLSQTSSTIVEKDGLFFIMLTTVSFTLSLRVVSRSTTMSQLDKEAFFTIHRLAKVTGPTSTHRSIMSLNKSSGRFFIVMKGRTFSASVMESLAAELTLSATSGIFLLSDRARELLCCSLTSCDFTLSSQSVLHPPSIHVLLRWSLC